jgi:hypothetical protein
MPSQADAAPTQQHSSNASPDAQRFMILPVTMDSAAG